MSHQTPLNKWLAEHGVSSRRKAVTLIEQGSVTVNNLQIDKPYFKVSKQDKITINGHAIGEKPDKVYYMLYKPKGYVSSTKTDEKKRPPVTTLIPTKTRLYPIGRLDIESEGLLLLTNDGNLTQQLTHPSFQTKKTYKILCSGQVTQKKIDMLSTGIDLQEGKTQPATVKIIGRQKNRMWLAVTITEGKYHQLRRMFERVSLHVEKLIRIKEGGLEIGDLRPGEYSLLTKNQVDILMHQSAK